MDRIANLKKITQIEKANSNIAQIIVVVHTIKSDHGCKLWYMLMVSSILYLGLREQWI